MPIRRLAALCGALAMTTFACAADNAPSSQQGDDRTGSPPVEPSDPSQGESENKPPPPLPESDTEPVPEVPAPSTTPPPDSLPSNVMIEIQGAVINPMNDGKCWDWGCDEDEARRVIELLGGLAKTMGADPLSTRAAEELALLGAGKWSSPDAVGWARPIVNGEYLERQLLEENEDTFLPQWTTALYSVPLAEGTALRFDLWDSDYDRFDQMGAFTLPLGILQDAASKKGASYVVDTSEVSHGRILFIQIAVHDADVDGKG